MIAIQAIDHVVLRVVDLDRMARFIPKYSALVLKSIRK